MNVGNRAGFLLRLRFGFRFYFQLDDCCDVLKQTNRNLEITELLDVIIHVDFSLLDLITVGAFPGNFSHPWCWAVLATEPA